MSTRRSIFRPEALQRYVRSPEIELKSLISQPLRLTLLWVIVSLCLLSGAIVGLARVPIYVSSQVVTRHAPTSGTGYVGASWIILVPERELSQLRIGQTINLLDLANTRVAKGAISAIEPRAIAAEAARLRFGFSACVFAGAPESLVVVIAEMTQTPPALSSEVVTEKRYRAEIEVKTKRVGAFLPGIGSWYDR